MIWYLDLLCKEGKRVVTKRGVAFRIGRAPEFNPDAVKAVRKGVQFTQEQMAVFMDVSVSTIRSWEQGVNHPTGSARRLLQALQQQPDAVLEIFSRIQ